ncbi:hypothetical protein SOVF_169720 [Spinacia oleracea]|uniref:Pre-SET domain-containing protein n=1 Tax=Spinacia oleracea TaxID=3562 RepID=A0A9R0IS67_SPIOL|nr:uncharacterized protein LOC110793988 [Spinacia oleracea]KNA07641.1 hypothetical protein SOVF_169720 [Spinacia oleracea]
MEHLQLELLESDYCIGDEDFAVYEGGFPDADTSITRTPFALACLNPKHYNVSKTLIELGPKCQCQCISPRCHNSCNALTVFGGLRLRLADFCCFSQKGCSSKE